MADLWPRLMKLARAAAYCDLSAPAFEREVLVGRLPMPILIGGKDHWDRNALDRAIDRLAGNADEPEWRQKLRDKLDGREAA